MEPFDVFIPVRYESARLPGKPLLDICGMTLISRVVTRAQGSGAERVFVATDSAAVAEEVRRSTTAEICETSSAHDNGTDRIAEAAAALGLPDDRVVVNLQGDEPLMPGSLIDEVAGTLCASPVASVATAAQPFADDAACELESAVKCIVDRSGHAIYFSRLPVPWQGDDPSARIALHHVGIYAYRAGYLKRHSERPRCELEKRERLEQLRVMYYGDRIAVTVAETPVALGVDTPEDLKRVREFIASVEQSELRSKNV